MGRIRTIKPEFFLHYELFQLEQEVNLPVRLSFAGLWTCCDREGCFVWKPEMLKTQVIPYDTANFGAILEALASKGFIEKYTVDGKDYGLIPSWTDHQIINNREASGKIPTREGIVITRAVNGVTRHGNYNDTPSGEGNGKEGNGKEHASLDASVAGRVLGEKVGNTNIRFQEQLSRQIIAESSKRGLTIEATVDFMAAQWELYNVNRPRLNYPVSSAQKFFESGTWHDSKLWPWKEGMQPTPSRKYVTPGVIQ